MIISALAAFYDQLLKERPDEVARPGWVTCRIKFRIVIFADGSLAKIVPTGEKRGTSGLVPAQAERTSGVKANFLCNKAAYFFGIDANGETDRAKRCFEAACSMHHEILDGVDSLAAKAILAYFDSWNSETAASHPKLGEVFQDVCKGGYLAFALLTEDGCLHYVEEDQAVSDAWDAHVSVSVSDDSAMVCLATGKKQLAARLHPSIKGVAGAHSAGAKLVSFNEPAFESYGHDGKQGRNAPVGESVAQAYGLALNYLLADPIHHIYLGDATIVFWSEHEDRGNVSLFSLLLGGRTSESQNDAAEVDRNLSAVLNRLRLGKGVDLNGVDFAAKFYVLGLAPSKSRLLVRFFSCGSFGDMIDNVEAHYRRIQIVHAPYERDFLAPFWLLRAVENQKSQKETKPIVSSELTAPLLQAILRNGKYPEALFTNALLRIKATREVTYEQAAIIKGYLIRNCGRSEEEVTVELNEERCDVAYNLGRAFSYLGQIQEKANGKDTLTGRYLGSACTRPAVVFPQLLKQANYHLNKLSRDNPGYAVNLEKELSDVLSEGSVSSFPNYLSLSEQGDFMLGYYHQKAKRYQKKEERVVGDGVNETEEA